MRFEQKLSAENIILKILLKGYKQGNSKNIITEEIYDRVEHIQLLLKLNTGQISLT